YTAEPNFSGLFRLIDDFDKYSSQATGSDDGQINRRGQHQIMQTFTPKFDLRETETAYELHGELPGIEKDAVHIEFNDEQTISIRGRVERSHNLHSGGDDDENPEKPVMVGRKGSADNGSDHNNKKGAHQNGGSSSTTDVAKANESDTQVSAATVPANKVKYWVSERSVGEFSRSFSFPQRVDSEHVTAALNNGVLNVTVPKAQKPLGRRIAIN
ncbi:heat shock protein 30, partial [Pseudomassariella vexata]